jgi:hypothetical protein
MNPLAYVIIVLVIVFFLYQILGGTITIAAGGVNLDNMDVKTTRIILIFSQFMFILAPTLFFTRLQTHSIKRSLRMNPPKIHMLLFAVLGILLIQPALQGYMFAQDYALNHLPVLNDSVKQLREIFDTIEQATLKIVTAHSPVEYIVVVIAISVTPAICEEFLFRGFVLRNLERTAKPAIAIFLTGFLFAFYHFQPLNMVPLVMLGVFLSFTVYCSDSIYTGITAHFVNNFLASFLLYKYGKEEFDTPHISSSEKMDAVILALGSLLFLITLMILMYRMRTKTVAEGIAA